MDECSTREQFNARIPKDLREAVRKFCKENNTSLDDFMTTSLRASLRDNFAVSFPDRAAEIHEVKGYLEIIEERFLNSIRFADEIQKLADERIEKAVAEVSSKVVHLQKELDVAINKADEAQHRSEQAENSERLMKQELTINNETINTLEQKIKVLEHENSFLEEKLKDAEKAQEIIATLTAALEKEREEKNKAFTELAEISKKLIAVIPCTP